MVRSALKAGADRRPGEGFLRDAVHRKGKEELGDRHFRQRDHTHEEPEGPCSDLDTFKTVDSAHGY